MQRMTHRQRVMAAFTRQMPDHVPKHATFTPFQLRQVQERTGFEDPADAFDFDMRTATFRPPRRLPDFSPFLPPDLPPGTTSDEWGLTEIPGTFYHFTEYVYPMAHLTDPRELDDWPFPDYTPPCRFAGVPQEIADWHHQGYFVLGSVGHIFETAWYIRSMEQLYHDWYFNVPFAERLLDEITGRRRQMAVRFAEADVDGISIGDDIGTQRGMMMSPDMWRRWLKPRWATVIKAAKGVKPDLIVTYHSDGNIWPAIPELAEIGVDVLNPVQPECLNPAAVKRRYGDRLAFWGGMGIQTTMPFGTPDDVRAEVKRLIEVLGAGGGFMIAPTHVLEPDVPWENIVAFFDAVEEYGAYHST
jgi:uroporphyrinogen decarboxylase